MTALEVKRKLAAILSADVEGYSRLMSEDEVHTIRTLTAYKAAMALAEQHIEESRKAGFTLGVVWGLTNSIMVKNKRDRLSEARQDAAEILKIWSWYNLDYVRSIFFYKDSDNLEHWIDGLRTAGIPEHHRSQ